MTQAEQRLDDARTARRLAQTHYHKVFNTALVAVCERDAALTAWDIANKEFLAARDDLEREDNDALSR